MIPFRVEGTETLCESDPGFSGNPFLLGGRTRRMCRDGSPVKGMERPPGNYERGSERVFVHGLACGFQNFPSCGMAVRTTRKSQCRS